MRGVPHILVASLALVAVSAANASAETPREKRALQLLSNCLSDPNRRDPRYEINVPASSYNMQEDELTGADHLNGITFQASIAVTVAFRKVGDTDWLQSIPNPGFPVVAEEKNGFMELFNLEMIPGIKPGVHCRSAKAAFY